MQTAKINRRYLEQNYSNMISNVLNNRPFPKFWAYQNRNRNRKYSIYKIGFVYIKYIAKLKLEHDNRRKLLSKGFVYG